MATYYWTGLNSGLFTLASNWQTAAGVTATEYPGQAQADAIVFDSRATAALSSGLNQSANANGISSVDWADYPFDLGTLAAPLVLKMVTGTWALRNTGNYALWLVNSASGATITATMTAGYDVHLVSAGALTLSVSGGAVELESALFGISNVAPTLNIDGTATVTLESGGGTVNLYSGTVYWNVGTITTLNNYGSTYLCNQSFTARTITTPISYGGVTDLRTGVPGTITLTNPIAYKGGTIYWDIGENLQRS